MQSDNVTDVEMRKPAYALAFGTVIALGLPLNAVSLWILLRRHSLKSPSAVFMVNLVISDLLLVISLPMRVYFYAVGTWRFGSMACLCITMLFRNNIRSSSVFITFISVDRLLAVVYPLRSRHLRTSTNAWKGAGLIWMMLLVMNVPESVHFLRTAINCSVSSCFEVDESFHSEEIAYLQLVLLFTMLTVNIVSTALVSWTLQRHLNVSAKVNNKVNVMLIFAMNLIMFTVFFLPVSLVVVFSSWRSVLNCLASVNCCFDPLLYYFSFDGFWRRKEDVDTSHELK